MSDAALGRAVPLCANTWESLLAGCSHMGPLNCGVHTSPVSVDIAKLATPIFTPTNNVWWSPFPHIFRIAFRLFQSVSGLGQSHRWEMVSCCFNLHVTIASEAVNRCLLAIGRRRCFLKAYSHSPGRNVCDNKKHGGCTALSIFSRDVWCP